jgi:hypothetical protein
MRRDLALRSTRGVLVRTREDRALVQHLEAVERRTIARRAEDVARRELSAGRMGDIVQVTDDALEAGGEIGARLEEEVRSRPYFARELVDIAATGARGLKSELRRYVGED